MKYSDQLVDWLIEEGYTHCFFVAGGNIMHLLNSVRSRLICVPFVNELGAAIAAEYFTEASEHDQKAFVLVTAGPGFTNTITAIASAWTESRELLVIGGQVKSSDLSLGKVRQLGIQEIDGVALASPICKTSIQIASPVEKYAFLNAVRAGTTGRKGPVFIEITLDAQGAPALPDLAHYSAKKDVAVEPSTEHMSKVVSALTQSQRPVLLIGGGVTRSCARRLSTQLRSLGIPIMFTWNGADRLPHNHAMNMGRPNTWGQRSSNVLIQQSDLVIAIGTRLGLQQTGFAWDEFVPQGDLIQVDIDERELAKVSPVKFLAIQADADKFLQELVSQKPSDLRWSPWVDFCREVRDLLPTVELENSTSPGYLNPYALMGSLAGFAPADANLIPCSSGGSFTVAMQTLQNVGTQRIISNKGMASMGYGLSGAIGASLSDPEKMTLLFEGDGGFAQNLQELGTVAALNANIKMFLFDNNGYASIRMTQRNYFNGAWIGCDVPSGLGLPDWRLLAAAYGIPFQTLEIDLSAREKQIKRLMGSSGPVFIRVPIDPEQTYFPKITSTMQENGSMKSNPLHLMDPPLSADISKRVFKYIKVSN